MKFSLGKILWNAWLKFFDISIKLFYVLCLALFILIVFQVNPGIEEFGNLFVFFTIVLSVSTFFQFCPVWIQGIYLWIYFKFGHYLISGLVSSFGMIDYNFAWLLPKKISDFIGVSIGGEFVDFIFWSGFILSALFLIDHFERQTLVFLVQKLKISWAGELLGERLEEFSKTRKITEGIIEVEKKGSEISSLSSPKEIKERIVLSPHFFKDKLWYQLFMFLSLVAPLVILPLLIGGSSILFNLLDILVKKPSGPLFWVFGGSLLSIFLIFLPFLIWEATTRIILEKDKIIIRTFFLKKKEILYLDIKNIDTQINEGLKIYYEKQTRKGKIIKVARLFPWAFTTEKLLKELKPRLNNVNISENFIINTIKSIKAARGLAVVLTVAITVGLLVGFLYYIIYQIENRPKFSNEECADRLEFWISDKSKIGILETKEGFVPELSIKSPFYLFINAGKTAPECDKKISLVIYNAKGNIVFQRGNIVLPEEGIASYRWESIIKERGNYLLKINYGDIPSKEIKFFVK